MTLRGSVFVVYGFELLVKVWPVSIVLVLVPAFFFGCVYSLILTVPPYIFFVMYHLPKRHMMGVHVCSSLTFNLGWSLFLAKSLHPKLKFISGEILTFNLGWSLFLAKSLLKKTEKKIVGRDIQVTDMNHDSSHRLTVKKLPYETETRLKFLVSEFPLPTVCVCVCVCVWVCVWVSECVCVCA
jgi:hypothetical protein